jgi:hypothetical protein
VVAGGGTGFEVCTMAAGCKQALGGVLGGEMYTPGGIDTTAAGTVFVVETFQHRIQKFVVGPPGAGGGEGSPPGGPGSDVTPPKTTITDGPPNKTQAKTAAFEYESSEPGSTFEYSLDGKAFKPVGDAKTVKVSVGKHVFEVRAIDPAGNVDPTPDRDRWKRKPKPKGT